MRKINTKFAHYLLPISLILILSFSRLIPHPWNFTPILAAGIFSGLYFKKFFFSLFIIIFSMFLADIFIGFHYTMFFTYISLFVAVILGVFIKHFKFSDIIYSDEPGVEFNEEMITPDSFNFYDFSLTVCVIA